MSIQSEIDRLKGNVSDSYFAVQEMGGTVPENANSDNLPNAIRSIRDGKLPNDSTPKDVNFYDYDGRLVYSYTLFEAQALTVLPDGPTHEGLVFQGWNWSLEKVKALTSPMNVGAMYITDDGKTRLKIRVWGIARSNVPLYISQTVANGVTIDWGDGSATETLDGTGNINTLHQYEAAGEYTIAFTVADGCMLGFGNGTSGYCVMGSLDYFGRAYSNMLQEVYIGHGITIVPNYGFNSCHSLTSITIPGGVNVGIMAFRQCYSLPYVTIPKGSIFYNYALTVCSSLSCIAIPEGTISIASGMIGQCYSLPYVTIPKGVIKINDWAFNECHSLSSIVIPESVTAIGEGAFNLCDGMGEYHLKSTTPPTLSSTNAFSSIPSDCVIYVPAGSLDAYKTAENWSTYADHMREEPQI